VMRLDLWVGRTEVRDSARRVKFDAFLSFDRDLSGSLISALS
jgi:hypothetical protein